MLKILGKYLKQVTTPKVCEHLRRLDCTHRTKLNLGCHAQTAFCSGCVNPACAIIPRFVKNVPR